MAQAQAAGRFLLGTSGFAYDAWTGSFYPEELKAKDRLAYYAARFSSVEINTTFRRFPTEKMLVTWRDATPAGFVFAVKAHMKITNARGLAGSEETAAQFVAALAPLGARSGPILLQYPPHLALDEARVLAFVDALPRGPRWVVESPHPSWRPVRPVLAARGVAWCVSESDEEDAPGDTLAEGPFHYLRLRRTRYAKAALEKWAERIRAALRAGRDVHCYFKHEDEGTGPEFASQLAKLVAR